MFSMNLLAQVKFCPDGTTVESRIPSLENCERISLDASFSKYLRNLRLKNHGGEVKLYNGITKYNTSVHCAVLDQRIGEKDLHQCADAIIRLKADYHYQREEYEQIAFKFTNGHKVAYAKWREGYRISINGNKTKWVKKEEYNNSKECYWQYLEQIFMYAGTYSLEQELKSVALADMQCGDVFIQGAFPGHAVMVIDMIMDTITEKKYFLLGQSYMPAQEFHILNNPGDATISPWYVLKEGELITPEWSFTTDQLRGWR